MNRYEEFQIKLSRLRGMMADNGYEAVALTTQANYAWLTAGGDNHVAMATETGVAYLLVTMDAVHLLTNNIEAARQREEELGNLPIQVHEEMWYEEDREGMAREIVSHGRVASDGSWPAGSENQAQTIARLRWQLLEPEIERYRWIGRQTAAALSETAHEIQPGMTEHEIAGVLAGKLLAQGITPAVLLVATDERCYQYRHPVPTSKKLERQAMLVIGARRWGLGVSATRIVCFGQPDDALRRRHEAVCRVDACFIRETVPGAKVAEILAQAVRVYRDVGYPDEWRLHHQGGATGYAPRDYRATFSCQETVLESQAFAWNPSISGTKSEDTIIVSANGQEIISALADWPILEVEHQGEALARPDILVR
jgi:Xaa-Pro dipeptidase